MFYLHGMRGLNKQYKLFRLDHKAPNFMVIDDSLIEDSPLSLNCNGCICTQLMSEDINESYINDGYGWKHPEIHKKNNEILKKLRK